MVLIHIYRAFHKTAAEFTVFSSVHGTFSGIDYVLGHKTNLNKLKKIKIVPCIFSDHIVTQLEINKRNLRKCTNKWK
jgi:hypothetical protein